MTETTCATCRQPIVFDVRHGVWRHRMPTIGQNDPAPHPVGPQKRVA